MTHFRRQRLAEFLKAFPNLENYSVLDVGGRPFIWDLLKQEFNVAPKSLVLLNTPSEGMLPESPDYTVMIADGRELPYEDKCFDLVFSNSVIEHVGNLEEMAQFAKECARVGREIYIQTPNRWFPLEAHFGAAFIHWLPRAWYRKLSFLSLRYLFSYKNPDEKRYFYQEFDTTLLVSKRQLQGFFPDKKILSERVVGIAKSLIVVNPQPQKAIRKSVSTIKSSTSLKITEPEVVMTVEPTFASSPVR
ncbi:MAG: methyltransferase domain-containing protein [Cyanobacteria bacterium P01_D01_bin.105]